MSSNPLNHKGKGNSPNVTSLGPTPADFPLGSPQSRAAARVMLSRRNPQLTQYDRDCLTIYHEVRVLDSPLTGAQAEPNRWDLEGNAVYQHGQAISFKMHPIIPAHENEPAKRSTRESREFELAFGSEPEPGDILRYEHVALMYHPEILESGCRLFAEAWARRVPELPCPKKFENGRMFVRSKRHIWAEGRDEVLWAEDESHTASAIWTNILSSLKYDLGEVLDPNVVRDLTFLGVGPRKKCGGFIENQHRCRPSTPEELARPDPEPQDGLLKTFRKLGIGLKTSEGGDYDLVAETRS